MGYEITKPFISEMMEDLAGLRNAMADMLIATSKDFAMRAVPREWQYGAVGRKDLKKEHNHIVDENEDVKEIKVCFLKFKIIIPLEENPDEMAMRFENMTRWDDTDHPGIDFIDRNLACPILIETGKMFLEINLIWN
ncbi:hypothetical protein AAMO2058_000248700 [Amorphochlora amoebiformis]